MQSTGTTHVNILTKKVVDLYKTYLKILYC